MVFLELRRDSRGTTGPWPVLAPAFATILTVMVFNYLGDCVRDVLDVEVAK